jgi:hypothetical protein
MSYSGLNFRKRLGAAQSVRFDTGLGGLMLLGACLFAWAGLGEEAASAGQDPRGGGQPPVVLSQPLSRAVTGGATDGGFMAFAVLASSSSAVTYQWYKDGQRVADGGGVVGATGSLLTIQPVTTSLQGTYVVAITNDSGGVLSSNATLTVTPLQVSGCSTNGGRDFVVRVSAQRGDVCRIEVSINFGAYQTNGYVTNYDRTADFLDHGPLSGFRQYRAILERFLPVVVTPPVKTDSALRVVGYGRRGGSYRVEASSDFTQWDLVSEVSDLTGWVDVTDSSVKTRSSRFYRIVEP